MPDGRTGDREREDRLRRALAIAAALVALALALISLYRSFGPKSQWGSEAPAMDRGSPSAPATGPATTPAPLPPRLR